MPADLDLLVGELSLRGPAGEAEVAEAISAPPELTRTIDGATTLTVDIRDQRRVLLRSGLFDSRSWAVVDGLHFELVEVGKKADTISLTFEDAVVAALRRRTDPRAFPAGSATRQQIATQLAAEAGVPLIADPAARPPVSAAVERSSGGQLSSSWELLGTLAEAADWRRFSDGYQVVFGSDDWLMARLPAVAMREHTDAVGTVDFDLDVGQPASRATVTVDSTRWSFPPAQPVDLLDHGPASGRWLVESFKRTLTRTSATVQLVRGQPSLAEAPPEDPATAAGGDGGVLDFLPMTAPPTKTATQLRVEGTTGGAAYATASQRRVDGTTGGAAYAVANGPGSVPDRMVAWAVAQKGLRYVWGGNGPTGYDCSHFVMAATRAAGKELAAPAASQWAVGSTKGRKISVEEALRTRGALLFTINPRIGNHVAISLGNGSSVEARSTADGVGTFPNASRMPWTGGVVWS